MTELPTGTVTLLFTDIQGSTRLLDELGDRWPGALADHNRLLRDVFGRHGGIEVDRQGDAFFVVFPARRRPRLPRPSPSGPSATTRGRRGSRSGSGWACIRASPS